MLNSTVVWSSFLLSLSAGERHIKSLDHSCGRCQCRPCLCLASDLCKEPPFLLLRWYLIDSHVLVLCIARTKGQAISSAVSSLFDKGISAVLERPGHTTGTKPSPPLCHSKNDTVKPNYQESLSNNWLLLGGDGAKLQRRAHSSRDNKNNDKLTVKGHRMQKGSRLMKHRHWQHRCCRLPINNSAPFAIHYCLVIWGCPVYSAVKVHWPHVHVSLGVPTV